MQQPIISYDQDELGDWRAILACGHRQHIRHNPPLVNRPWVLSEEGRRRFLGAVLECKLCDEAEPVGDGVVSAEALEAIYDRFHDELRRYVRPSVTELDAAEAVLLDVYRHIHGRIDDLSDDERAESWLYRIVEQAIDEHSGRATNQDTAPSALAPAIEALLACLPGELRQTILLVEYRGFSLAELGDRLDILPATAAARLQQARAKLREALLDCCHVQYDRHGRTLPHNPRCPACAG